MRAALKHGIPETDYGIQNLWKKVPGDWFEKQNVSNDNKITKQIKKDTDE